MAFPVNENKITLKSGYGKYLGIDKNGVVVGRSDAVSALEQFEPIFQDGKIALLTANGKFVSVSPDDDSFYAHSATAGDDQILKVPPSSSYSSERPSTNRESDVF